MIPSFWGLGRSLFRGNLGRGGGRGEKAMRGPHPGGGAKAGGPGPPGGERGGDPQKKGGKENFFWFFFLKPFF